MLSNVVPEVCAFVKEVVKNINEGMSLKQYFEDDSDTVTMVFSMESFPRQFQVSFFVVVVVNTFTVTHWKFQNVKIKNIARLQKDLV